jgi:hypothetical protein
VRLDTTSQYWERMSAEPRKKTRLDKSNEEAAYIDGRNAALDDSLYDLALSAWEEEGMEEHFFRGYNEVKANDDDVDSGSRLPP